MDYMNDLTFMYNYYQNNKNNIDKLEKRKQYLINKRDEKQNYLSTLADKITTLTNKYMYYVKQLNLITVPYFKYEKLFNRIFHINKYRELKEKMEYYNCKTSLLIREIKNRDIYYKKEQKRLIDIENMILEIERQIEAYNIPLIVANEKVERKNQFTINKIKSSA